MVFSIASAAYTALLVSSALANPITSNAKRDIAGLPELGDVTIPTIVPLDQLTKALPLDFSKKERRLLGLPLDISAGSLIPSIPGVTEPLSSNAPPLPVLQLPTPPLPSEPYTVSNIRPKKIGYFWTGAGDNEHADFLVTTSLDDVRMLVCTA
jgi:hypothetical protein